MAFGALFFSGSVACLQHVTVSIMAPVFATLHPSNSLPSAWLIYFVVLIVAVSLLKGLRSCKACLMFGLVTALT